LASFLFTIVLDYAMRQALDGREEIMGFLPERRRSKRHPAVLITDTEFADDIALILKMLLRHKRCYHLLKLNQGA